MDTIAHSVGWLGFAVWVIAACVCAVSMQACKYLVLQRKLLEVELEDFESVDDKVSS